MLSDELNSCSATAEDWIGLLFLKKHRVHEMERPFGPLPPEKDAGVSTGPPPAATKLLSPPEHSSTVPQGAEINFHPNSKSDIFKDLVKSRLKA